MFDDFGRETARFADFPVGGVVFELEREEFSASRLKSRRAIDGPIRLICSNRLWNSALRNKNLAQSRGEI